MYKYIFSLLVLFLLFLIVFFKKTCRLLFQFTWAYYIRVNESAWFLSRFSYNENVIIILNKEKKDQTFFQMYM